MSDAKIKLPDFVIIGSMKSGTTSIWSALKQHKDIYLGNVKELNLLSQADKTDDYILRQYSRYFRAAKPEQLKGEASTDYTKIYQYTDVHLRADRLLKKSTKFIYILRDPVERIESQYNYYYNLSGGNIQQPLEWLKSHHQDIKIGAYSQVMERWLAVFPAERFLLLRFEDFRDNPESALNEITRFLKIPPLTQHNLMVKNKSANQFVRLGSIFDKIARSSPVRYYIRPLIPEGIEKLLMKALFRPAVHGQAIFFDEECRRYIVDVLKIADFELHATLRLDHD